MSDRELEFPPNANGWSFSGIPLAFWGARHHPDRGARAAIAKGLARWARIPAAVLAATRPPADLTAILHNSGTDISSEEAGDAAALVALLFSQTVDASRLRIASSCDRSGDSGFTMTRGDRGYVVRDKLNASPSRAENVVAYLHPVEVPSALVIPLLPAEAGPASSARVEVCDIGITIRVNGARWYPKGGGFEQNIQLQSSVMDGDRKVFTFGELSLRVTQQEGALAVHARSSEAIIRLTALMARGAWMVLTPGRSEGGVMMRVVLELALPAAGGTGLRMVQTDPVPELSRWLRVACKKEPSFPLTLRTVLATHLPLHDRWIDQALISHILGSSPSLSARG